MKITTQPKDRWYYIRKDELFVSDKPMNIPNAKEIERNALYGLTVDNLPKEYHFRNGEFVYETQKSLNVDFTKGFYYIVKKGTSFGKMFSSYKLYKNTRIYQFKMIDAQEYSKLHIEYIWPNYG